MSQDAINEEQFANHLHRLAPHPLPGAKLSHEHLRERYSPGFHEPQFSSEVHHIPIETASGWADPNVNPQRLWHEERPYMENLASNMRTHGQQEPILVRTQGGKNRILEGNHRLHALKALGVKHIAVRYEKGPEE